MELTAASVLSGVWPEAELPRLVPSSTQHLPVPDTQPDLARNRLVVVQIQILPSQRDLAT